MHSDNDFKLLAKRTSNAHLRIRYLALFHFKSGVSRTKIAPLLGVSCTSVNAWVANYLADGLDGLLDKPKPGRPNQLSPHQLEQLKKFIEKNAIKQDGGRLIAEDIRVYICNDLHVSYSLANVYRLLHALDFSWITSRSKHPKQSDEAQAAFKNFLMETILHIPGHLSLERVDVWFQDEARFGQQNQMTRLWAKRGSRPRVVKQQQFDYGYLFGAVCPSSGKTEALITPLANKDAMMLHLELISLATESDRHAVVIVDGTGWHAMDTAMPFSNLTLIKLPAYSPAQNPMDQVWQWLRQHCLSNRVFDCYEQIVEQVSRAWNTFIEDTGRVKSLCSRDWINLTR
ncbi:IS630 family transposase [Shewanella algae]|nr:IS630 family transposase [Shewanella algae]MCE9827292.1 IS630 family transposase [Shewanella algae]